MVERGIAGLSGWKKEARTQRWLDPGVYLATTYSHRTCRPTTIGAEAFHFRVRNGTGWFHLALVTRGQSWGGGMPASFQNWVSGDRAVVVSDDVGFWRSRAGSGGSSPDWCVVRVVRTLTSAWSVSDIDWLPVALLFSVFHGPLRFRFQKQESSRTDD